MLSCAAAAASSSTTALASAVRQAQPCRFDVPSIVILLSGTAIRARSWAAAVPAKRANIAMAVIGVLVIVPPSYLDVASRRSVAQAHRTDEKVGFPSPS